MKNEKIYKILIKEEIEFEKVLNAFMIFYKKTFHVELKESGKFLTNEKNRFVYDSKKGEVFKAAKEIINKEWAKIMDSELNSFSD